MAFGKKQARIEQLEAEASIRDKEMTDLAPYVGIAKEIQAGVVKIALETDDFDKAYSQTLADVARESRLLAAEHIAQSLPTERLLELLTTTYNDPELKEALEAVRQNELLKASGRLDLTALREKAKKTGIVNLTDIIVGSQVQIQLCKSDTSAINRKTHADAFLLRGVTGYMEQDGYMHVTDDNNHNLSNTIEDHELVRFGTYNPTTTSFSPDMYVDASIVLHRKGDSRAELLTLDLMQVLVDQQPIVVR